jgi:hypothetical protein
MKPLTLKQLKARQNTPVFVVCIDPTPFAIPPVQGWGLVRTSWVRLWHLSDCHTFDYHFEDYKKLWLAYPTCTDPKLIKDWCD